jgi:acyl-homoserine lactone acylase PvdQ
MDAAARSPQTFNSFYASATEAAFYTSGAFPVRGKRVTPDLPIDGRGKHEWKGELATSRHPSVVNPASGLIVNWNNKPARGFPAADDRFGSEASLQRVRLLELELAAREKHDGASLLSAANAAATQDVRGRLLWPTVRRVLARTKAPNAQAEAAAGVLDAWQASGASRVDTNADGQIDEPGAALIDAAWPGLWKAALCDRLGKAGCAAIQARSGSFDAPPGGQYAGYHQAMWKDLRAVLGDKVKGRYSTRYCGKGNAKTCSKKLWKALDGAAKQLGPDAASWTRPTAVVTFSPLELTPIQYTNRPSGIHLVMQFAP